MSDLFLSDFWLIITWWVLGLWFDIRGFSLRFSGEWTTVLPVMRGVPRCCRLSSCLRSAGRFSGEVAPLGGNCTAGAVPLEGSWRHAWVRECSRVQPTWQSRVWRREAVEATSWNSDLS